VCAGILAVYLLAVWGISAISLRIGGSSAHTSLWARTLENRSWLHLADPFAVRECMCLSVLSYREQVMQTYSFSLCLLVQTHPLGKGLVLWGTRKLQARESSRLSHCMLKFSSFKVQYFRRSLSRVQQRPHKWRVLQVKNPFHH
jgi:hypothetical protein